MDRFTLPFAQWTDADWSAATAEALRAAGSLLTLSRSPLARAALIGPALVLDEVTPSAEERGRALYLVLQWAVRRLAPAPSSEPPGSPRPFDDPTWRDRRWWATNLLRHRYLEPLHPDEFVPGGRYTETLIALTGIPGEAAYYAERNRAVDACAARLRDQALTGAATAAIRRDAVAAALGTLDGDPDGRAALEAAAVFRGVFGRTRLLDLLHAERLSGAAPAVDRLLSARLLRSAADGSELWLAPALRDHLYARLPDAVRRRRHAAVARLHESDGLILRAAAHAAAAGQTEHAAELLLAHAPALVRDLQHSPLLDALRALDRRRLSAAVRQAVAVWEIDLALQYGEPSAARRACRRALGDSADTVQQGRLYRRLAKLYENHNPLQALAYFREALARLPADHPERIDALKDRGWLLLLRRDWDAAGDDWQRALALQPTPAQRADVLDGLAVLHARRGEPQQALALGQEALVLREQLGDPARVARSQHNLALAYDALGRYGEAIAAYREALAFFRHIDDRAAQATVLLSLGASEHLDGHLAAAVGHYRDCLRLCQAVDLPLVQVKAHGNLAEALAELGEGTAAVQAWEQGYALAQRHGFADQLGYLRGLQQQFPALAGAAAGAAAGAPGGEPAEAPVDDGLDGVAARALALARADGAVTARQLQAATGVSKATATRRLGELTAAGRLVRRGARRGAHYVLPDGDSAESPPTPTAAHLADHLPVLRATYRLAALGQLPARGATLRLVAAFSRLPELDAFFALERYLTQALGGTVDVVPWFGGGDSAESSVTWLVGTPD